MFLQRLIHFLTDVLARSWCQRSAFAAGSEQMWDIGEKWKDTWLRTSACLSCTGCRRLELDVNCTWQGEWRRKYQDLMESINKGSIFMVPGRQSFPSCCFSSFLTCSSGRRVHELLELGFACFHYLYFWELVQYQLLFTSHNFLYNSSGWQTEAHLCILLFAPILWQ